MNDPRRSTADRVDAILALCDAALAECGAAPSTEEDDD